MNLSLHNICFLCFSPVSAWFIMRAMECLIKINKTHWKQCLMWISCLVLGHMIIYIGDPFNILATIPCFLIAILITCEGSLWQKITVGTMYANTIFSFNALRDNYLKPLLYTPNFTELLVYTRSYTEYNQVSPHAHLPYLQIISEIANLLFAILLYAGMRRFSPDKDYLLSDSLWKLLLLLTATPFGIVLSIVTLVLRDGYVTDSVFPMGYLTLLVIAQASFISLLWCTTVLARQQKLEQQNMFMEMNNKYYETMEQQHFEIRRLKHDLANHMQVLSALSPEQQQSYIKNLVDHTAAIQPLSYCKDTTVNAVVSVKKSAFDRSGIRMELSVDIPKQLPFDKTDVCALYANALDNAAEACMKLPPEKRTICLRSKAQKGIFCLEVSNPISDTKKRPDTQAPYSAWISGHLPLTSKPDKANHGFGLKSIHEIVLRYHGNMELKTEDNVFGLFLYIPLC